MQERDSHAVGSRPWSFVDELDSSLFQLRDGLINVVDFEGDVVNSFALLLEIFPNGRRTRCILQKLNGAIPNRDESNFHALELFRMGHFHRKALCKELHSGVEILDSNPKVGNSLDLHVRTSPLYGETVVYDSLEEPDDVLLLSEVVDAGEDVFLPAQLLPRP